MLHSIGRSTRHRLSPGFTVLELLIVMTVSGVVAAISIPNFMGMMKRQRHVSAAENVANLMRQTRIRAIRDHRDYTVQVVGTTVTGMSGFVGGDEVELDFDQPHLALETAADCFGHGTTNPAVTFTAGFYAASVTYNATGASTSPGAICLTDGDGNLLQVGLDSINGQPKIRKWLPGTYAPNGHQGFYERSSAAFGGTNVWKWF